MGETFDGDRSAGVLSGVDRVIHIAGVNRGTEPEVFDGNVLFATQLANALTRAENKPRCVVFANSIQSGNGTPYGRGKAMAAEILSAAADAIGAEFVDLKLPNLFGEHGQPFYNSVVATFCHQLAIGDEPVIDNDSELTLLHAQNATDLLIGLRDYTELPELTTLSTVSAVLGRLRGFSKLYGAGDIPDISADFDRDLFNTFRSSTFPDRAQIRLDHRADARGSFFEIVRSHGGQGHSSFSTTLPSMRRGDHFHRRKIERFTVLAGEAVISLRKLFSTDVISFSVSGQHPVSIDMPTMWAHNITNVGDTELFTAFWSNEIFDAANPDTFTEAV